MRMLLLAAVVAVLAVPTSALADGGGSTSPGVAKRLAPKKAKKAKKLHVELKRNRSGAAGGIRTRERELEGLVTSLAPLTVASFRQGSSSLTCDVPAGVSLAGLRVGDRVEITCDLVGDRWVLRKLEQKGHAKGGDPGGTQGSTSACDDDDDDSGKLDDHDDDCGQHGDDDHEDDGDDD